MDFYIGPNNTPAISIRLGTDCHTKAYYIDFKPGRSMLICLLGVRGNVTIIILLSKRYGQKVYNTTEKNLMR